MPRTPLVLLPLALALSGCGSRTGLEGGSAVTTILPDGGAVPYRGDCPGPDQTLIYVVTEQGEFWKFSPSSMAFTSIGPLSCPSPNGSPFSMAVNRKGTAFVLYDDGDQFPIFRVSGVDGSCQPTSYVTGQKGFTLFGMGFATNQGGPDETLYVADADNSGQGSSQGLATIDTTTFQLSLVAGFSDPIARPELTGTGDGRLFAFYSLDQGNTSRIAQIDKTTAGVLAQNNLPTVEQGNGWAFGFWGGDFWLFTGDTTSQNSAASIVTRFSPSDGSVTKVASLSQTIVGAGVSTCAPQ